MKYFLLPKAIKYHFPLVKKVKPFLKLFKGNAKAKKQASERYCYCVWLRHLSVLNDNNLDTSPKIVAELGPGDSLGVGIMSILSGADKYYSFDVHPKTTVEENIGLASILSTMLLDKEPIPNQEEFPRVYPELEDYSFPSRLINLSEITDNKLRKKSQIIDLLLENMESTVDSEKLIHYVCPWNDDRLLKKGTVDLVFSQAVLEHVDDLEGTYSSMSDWLKKGGLISHQIDFKAHGTSKYWNGHWSYSDYEWKLIRADHPYSLNRAPLSVHLKLIKKNGFEVIDVRPTSNYPSGRYKGKLDRKKLFTDFQKMSDEDYNTCSAHIVAIKK